MALDAEVAAFRCRPVGETPFPYLWPDALLHHVLVLDRRDNVLALLRK